MGNASFWMSSIMDEWLFPGQQKFWPVEGEPHDDESLHVRQRFSPLVYEGDSSILPSI